MGVSLVICSHVPRQANWAHLCCNKRVPHCKSGTPQDPHTFQVSAAVPLVTPSHVAPPEAVWEGITQAQSMAIVQSATTSLFLLTKNLHCF